LEAVENRMALFMGLPLDYLETLQIVHYSEGQEFKAHNDWFADANPSGPGNRSQTLLVFLNDIEDGGQTGFKELDISVEPRAGRAIHWFNCKTSKEESCDGRLIHAGLPPRSGEKFAVNCWGRTGPWRGVR
jgi:prolyl 4-hydroxylase